MQEETDQMDRKRVEEIILKHHSLERIFADAMIGCLDNTQEINDFLLEEYEITETSTFGILGIWMGDIYETHRESIQKGLEMFQVNDLKMKSQCVNLPNYQMQMLVFYPMGEVNQYSFYQRSVLNEIRMFTPERCIFQAERCTGIYDLKYVVEEMLQNLEWNLVFGSRVLINTTQIDGLHIVPLSYLEELNGKVEKAIIQNNTLLYEKCFETLRKHCRKEVHNPVEIKSVCIEYCAHINDLAKKIGKKDNEVSYFYLVKDVIQAKYWREIWEALLEYTTHVFGKDNEAVQYSLLVSQARILVLKHYNEGITLEEIAERLYVSEEHLSYLFKKETGITFSETIRGVRIENIKQLLVTSQLKMNEIAKLSGYTDPKYMSKVFKEAMGMSPNEYRKINIPSN